MSVECTLISPPQRWEWAAVAVSLLLLAHATAAQTVLSVTPSLKWYGDDGDWSAVSLRMGNPAQWVDVLVNTQSSETWLVGLDGCAGNNSLCTSSRGGVFDSSTSSTWRPLGFFNLGVNEEIGDKDYAYYGLDSLTFGSTGTTLPSAIIGVVNATENTWLGSFGLGTIPGNFNGKSPLSAISALAETKGLIQSHSYGYTAGARYQQKGVPVSLTLGGFDANRFMPHNITFSLNPSQQAQASVESISVFSASAASEATITNWTTPFLLLTDADRVSAIIDSSTPFLWLPKSVCDRFASALGLSYNSSLNLYAFDEKPSQHQELQDAKLTFTFTLTDLTSSDGKVNITLGYSAFDLQLTYPAIPNTTYGSEDSVKYYFPLRQATNEAQYRIGRAFLQEAYIIVDYERNTFSVHQAIHTSNPINNVNIIAISRYDLTNFSGPANSSKKTVSTGAIIGIVIGALTGFALALIIFCLLRRSSRETSEAGSEKEKNFPMQSTGVTFLARFLRRGQRNAPYDHHSSRNHPAEVGADASHERFEMPAPLGPVELDSESGTLGATTEHESTQDSRDLSAYERARRKLERQQAAATMRRAADGSVPEKSENDISQVAHYRAAESLSPESPLISPLGAESGGSFSIPSPLTPSCRPPDTGPPPTYRRISPQKVVYVGRLPNNVQLPSNIPKVIGRDGRTINSEGSDPPSSSLPASPLTDSLGSNFTVDETIGHDDLYGTISGNNHSAISPISDETRSDEMRSGSYNFQTVDDENLHIVGCRDREVGDNVHTRTLDHTSDRGRLGGNDLVHVPQPAHNRFSWEEERISGNADTL